MKVCGTDCGGVALAVSGLGMGGRE
jgi:hypothetical protein